MADQHRHGTNNADRSTVDILSVTMRTETNGPLFKRLTCENWRELDQTASHIKRIKPDGTTENLAEDDWAAMILRYSLSEKVPFEVRAMFEVAQGALCYGCFFYPLYTLGNDQLFRLHETAMMEKCRQLKAPRKIKSFAAAIHWLTETGSLPAARFSQWDAARRLRNSVSHAERQHIIDPTSVVRSLDTATELINELFEAD